MCCGYSTSPKPSLDAEEFNHYRPVSGLNFISKTIQCVVTKQLKHHLTANELDNLNHFALSTEMALLKITDDVKLNLAQANPSKPTVCSNFGFSL